MQSSSLKQYLEYLKLSGIDELYVKTPSGSMELDDNSTLDHLQQKYSQCRKCVLHEGRIRFVYGEGNPSARLMLIGEGPGAEENATGRPFVGRAGQLLTKMLKAIHLEREDVYITNVVKCRPPNNRNPLPDEIRACAPYLDEQISLIAPRLILLLGRVAAEALLNLNLSLTLYREKTYEYRGVKTYVTYHPSALLRNPGWKQYAWIDLQKLRDDYFSLT